MKSSNVTTEIIRERERKITIYQTLLRDNLVGEDYNPKRAEQLCEIITEEQVCLSDFKRCLE